VVIALGETGGAAMSRFRPHIERYAAARVEQNAQAHGLSGSAEYDAEVRDRAVFSVEAGLSFFHTHAEGVGLILFFASTLVARLLRSGKRNEDRSRVVPRLGPPTECPGLAALVTMIPETRAPLQWRLPPVAVLLTAVVLIGCAEVGGASMVRFKVELTRWARH